MALVDDNGTPMHNVTGACLFIGYVLAALILTAMIVLDLYQAYRYRLSFTPKQTKPASKQLQVLVALAVLIFSSLSYHMLSYLISSYRDWAQFKGLAVPSGSYSPDYLLSSSKLGIIVHLWQWLTESALFYHFAKTICQNSAIFWWTLQALLVSAASALFISIEGSRRQVPHLWAYLCIGQILPISFAQSLFFVAMILFPVPDASRMMKVPGLPVQCLPLLAYYLFVFSAPFVLNEPAFVSVVFVIRLLLLCPFVFRIPLFEVFSPKSIAASSIHSGYLASYNLGFLCSLILCIQQTYVAMNENSFTTILTAINRDPAVSALGFDFVLYVVLCATWATFNPDLIDISR